MICQYATPDGSTGYHCRGGKMDGLNVSSGTCRACLAGKLHHHVESTPPPCIPHATFCHRFGLPTGESACAVCTSERETDPEFAQHMRTIGFFYGAMNCRYRQDLGKTEQRVCCGGKVKDVPVYTCSKTGNTAECQNCTDKAIL